MVVLHKGALIRFQAVDACLSALYICIYIYICTTLVGIHSIFIYIYTMCAYAYIREERFCARTSRQSRPIGGLKALLNKKYSRLSVFRGSHLASG